MAVVSKPTVPHVSSFFMQLVFSCCANGFSPVTPRKTVPVAASVESVCTVQ